MARKCFVIMPFGVKTDANGSQIDFDKIFNEVIKPSVVFAGLECLRCDEFEEPGRIHKGMIEQIYGSDIAVVDITTLNPNVFYELGIRHALRESGTVLIRKKNTKIPFNIEGERVIEYDLDTNSKDKAKDLIVHFIKNALAGFQVDSPVHEILKLPQHIRAKPIGNCQIFSYSLKEAPQKQVCLITGDVRQMKGIDVWVNSENIYMEMARFSESSLSSTIRYLGAEKDDSGFVIGDTIASELKAALKNRVSVPPAQVIVTSAGELQRTNGVKAIFHVASVTGQTGRGFAPIQDISCCVTNALRKVDELATKVEGGIRTILFPLFGTGVAKGDLRKHARILIEAAICYMEDNAAASTVERAYFICWSEQDLYACRSVLENINGRRCSQLSSSG